MMGDKYTPRTLDELAQDPIPVTVLNEPLPPENVGVLVPGRQRSLHAVMAQNLADVEGLIARLELGVAVATSGRGLIRDLYVQCRKQREVLSAALRLELE
jgi:hypothetical protein